MHRTSEKWRTFPPDVLPMFVAEMDYALAPPIARALHAAIDRSDTGYAWPKALRDVFPGYAARAFGWDLRPEYVFTVNDVMGGITEALRALTSPGDGIVIMPPVYPPFFEIIRAAGRRVVEAPLCADRDWAMDTDAIERALRDGARVVLLCNPHNPVGRVFTEAELHALADLAALYDALVISDEIHAQLLYPGFTHVPFERVASPLGVESVVLMSASKGWNIPGLKCAQMIAGSERTRAAFTALPKDVSNRVGHLGVIATIAAYEEGDAWLRETLALLDANRTRIARALPDVGYRIPDATYLAWLDFRETPLGDEPARALVSDAKVALTRGRAFGEQGRGYARLNFATSPDVLDDALARIRACIDRATSSRA